MPIYLFATLDTKGHEIAFVRDRLAMLGLDATIVDCGCLGEPLVPTNIDREQNRLRAKQNLTRDNPERVK